jgi:hypothetical protein
MDVTSISAYSTNLTEILGTKAKDNATQGQESSTQATASVDTYVPSDATLTEDIGIYTPTASTAASVTNDTQGAAAMIASATQGAGGASGSAAASSSGSSDTEDLEDELEEEEADKIQKQIDQLDAQILTKQNEIYMSESETES